MENTYLFTGIYETTYANYLKEKLEKDGWIQYKNQKKPDILFFFHNNYNKYEHKYYDIHTKLQNILYKGNNGTEIVTDKYNLYFNMFKYNPDICEKHMMKSYNIDKNFKVLNNKVYIIKPVGGGFFGGHGIKIITSQKEYNQLFSSLKSNKYIISEYLMNPLLYKKKKFHLRVLFLVTCINNEIDWSVFNIFKVILSKENYIASDFSNSNIHDTHFKYNTKDTFLNNNLYKNFNLTSIEYKKITQQIFNILKNTFNLMKKNIRPYENAENAFEIFGCDFLIDTNLIVYLLEVNDHIGHGYLDPNNKSVINVKKKMSRWIFDKTIKKLF